MEDKLAKVIAEIKRLKEIAEYNLSHSKMDRGAWMQQASVCTNLLSFIDSMQKEPIDDDIEKAVDEYLSTYFGSEQEKQNWPFLKKMAMHFAAWQKQKDAEAINENALLYNARLEGIDIGKAEIKQQMMKDAVECKIAVAYDNNYGGYTQLVDSKIPLVTFGQKVKLIIMKEDSGVADRQKKFFRHHRGGFEDSMRTMVEVGGLDDIRRIVTETSIFKDFYKNIRISGEGVRDERCIPYGWGDTVYFVVADFDGYTAQCIGWTNFKES